MGLATLAEDGFVSVDAGKIRPGKLVTRPFAFQGKKLVVNFQASKHNHGAGQPEIKAELLGVSHQLIDGFKLDQSDPLRTIGGHEMRWQGKGNVGALAGKPVRIRFSIRNAKLYSFRFR